MKKRKLYSRGSAAMADLGWLVVILIIIWFVWYFAIGPNKPSSEKPFIKPAAPLDTGQTYGPN